MNVNIKRKGRILKEQFINGINNDEMMTEIIWELTTIRKTSEITSEHVLAWTEGWKCRQHKRHSRKPQDDKGFNTMKMCKQKNNTFDRAR